MVKVNYLSRFQDSAYQVSDLQLFRGVKQDAAQKVVAACPVVHVAAGETASDVLHRGGNLYVLLRGELSVETDQDADERSSYNVLPGECFGEISVFDEQAGAPLITARQDAEILVIEAAKLWEIIDEIHGVARNLLHLLSFRIQAANARLRQRRKVGQFYQQLSMLDGLTGLHNRAWLDENLPLMIGNAGASVRPLSVIMVDLDHFKRFNDENGHLAGDEALRTAAQVFSEALRPTDYAVRYGGEEFIVVLPGTDQKTGVMVANRLCNRMREAIVFDDMRLPLPHVTGSFGVAALRAGQNAEALIACADEALYRAQAVGTQLRFGMVSAFLDFLDRRRIEYKLQTGFAGRCRTRHGVIR